MYIPAKLSLGLPPMSCFIIDISRNVMLASLYEISFLDKLPVTMHHLSLFWESLKCFHIFIIVLLVVVRMHFSLSLDSFVAQTDLI